MNNLHLIAIIGVACVSVITGIVVYQFVQQQQRQQQQNNPISYADSNTSQFITTKKFNDDVMANVSKKLQENATYRQSLEDYFKYLCQTRPDLITTTEVAWDCIQADFR